MRWLQLSEVLELHRRLLAQGGGTPGLRDLRLLEASLALPRQSFAGADLFPGLIAKAAALGFSLLQNHPFEGGSKRIGHAVLEITLVLNGLVLPPQARWIVRASRGGWRTNIGPTCRTDCRVRRMPCPIGPCPLSRGGPLPPPRGRRGSGM
jgi:death-on-curing protein